jgi:type IV secretion system protein VirD4
MDGGKCIMMLRGVRPFFSKKYDITKHPRYIYLSDHDKKNTFDVDKYLERLRKPRPKLAPNQPFELYEIADESIEPIGEIE